MYADEEGDSASHSQEPSHDGTSEDQHDDDHVPYFKVAVETLISELFVVVGDQLRSPAEIGAGLKENEVWCSLGRFGVHGREEGRGSLGR